MQIKVEVYLCAGSVHRAMFHSRSNIAVLVC